MIALLQHPEQLRLCPVPPGLAFINHFLLSGLALWEARQDNYKFKLTLGSVVNYKTLHENEK